MKSVEAVMKRMKELSKKLKKSEDQTARWIGSDAVRELGSEKVTQRLKRKSAQI